ncbi:MAG: tRNA-dihydrouridine synthase family protein [Lachnospiraceae bacterium]|jgi:tRNA-dihydrouridine synthase|nr:tRNA-dihydrouridine synthase family protein [Lachnospiraceae bacterium]
MKIYMAPMEGITNHIYRRAYCRYFGQIDRYFTPFLTNTGLNHKELADILPENNEGMELIPQILTNRTEVFLELSRTLYSFGYTEVNLNLGCPSGTVAAKGRGSGFLRHLPQLECFLDRIFDSCPLKISVKTRIGYDSLEEWPEIWQLLGRYPFTEWIIHPRLREEYYRGEAHREAFSYAYEAAIAEAKASRLCYNGDIRTLSDYESLLRRFPGLTCVMPGRGLIADPGLAGELRGLAPMTGEQLAPFLDEVLQGYRKAMSGDRNVLYRMMELWSYLSRYFEDGEKIQKKIRKAHSIPEYEQVVEAALKTRWRRDD